MSKSGQRFIKENRAPRVHIEYEVETEGAMEKVSLPFVMGVMADLSGKPKTPNKPLGQRDFVEIDRDNFNDVMSRIAPGLNIKVENTLADDGSEMAVNLKFKSMEDFDPDRIVQQVEPLRKLVEARKKLADLRSKMDGNEKLETMLEDILANADKQKALSEQLGIDAGQEG